MKSKFNMAGRNVVFGKRDFRVWLVEKYPDIRLEEGYDYTSRNYKVDEWMNELVEESNAKQYEVESVDFRIGSILFRYRC